MLTLHYGPLGSPRIYTNLLVIDIMPPHGGLSHVSMIRLTSLDQVQYLPMPMTTTGSPLWEPIIVTITGDERVLLSVCENTFKVSSAHGFTLRNLGEDTFFINRIGGGSNGFLLRIQAGGSVSTAALHNLGNTIIHFDSEQFNPNVESN